MLKKTLKKICPKFILNFYIDHLYEKIVRCKNRFRYSRLIKTTAAHYRQVEKAIRQRTSSPLRFASYVEYDASFSAYGLMDLMLADPQHYDAKIVVIPDITRGKENLVNQYKLTKEFFVKTYGAENVLDGYDIATDTYKDYSDQFDIINLANPYDEMVNEVHGIKYLSTRNVLPVYISYGCMPDKYGCNVTMPLLEISLFWKVFADNKLSYQDYKKYELAKGKNVSCTGYAKMDQLAKVKEIKREKKTIVIAPHHTINNPALPLSNFLKYSDLILELPEKFPEVNFIFRPHPLLFINLINEGFWTKEEVEAYKNKLKELGITYSYGGNYFDIFVNSDAIIHDCSSFVVEWLYTDKPCCFAGNEKFKKIFTRLGKKCLENYYLAFNREEICNFIEEVVIKGNDSLKDKRLHFANNHLKLNYPYVSKVILSQINI